MAKKSSEPKFPVNRELEAAVIARAEEDAPRLMYADWLDDHGDPDRAAFIRTQVALWDKNPADADYVELLNREEELLSNHTTWRLERKLPDGCVLSAVHEGGKIDTDFQRGFAFFLSDSVDAEQFKKALSHIFQKTTIRGFGVDVEAIEILAADPHRHSVQAINSYRTSTEMAKWLVAANFDERLQRLGLNYLEPRAANEVARFGSTLRPRHVRAYLGQLSATEVVRFLSSEAMSGLRHLEMDCPNATIAAVKALTSITHLHTLQLGSSASLLTALSCSGQLSGVARLTLFRTDLRGAGAVALAKVTVPELRALEFHACNLHNNDTVALTSSPLFDRLRLLKFTEGVGDGALKAIAASASAKTLQCLELHNSSPTKFGLRAIAPAFPDMRKFVASGTKSQRNCANTAQFVSTLACERLEVLSTDYPLDDAGAIALAKNPALASVRAVHFHGTDDLTTRGITALVTSPVLSNLVRLFVSVKNPDQAAELLLDRTVLPNLREITWSPKDEMRKRLLKARPNLILPYRP